jgi:hypothetical protein
VIRQALVLFWVVMATCAFAESPDRFYLTSETGADVFPFSANFILDASADGADTVLRYIQITPLSNSCPRSIAVRAVSARLRNISPATIVSRNNPCSIDPGVFQETVRNHEIKALMFASSRLGIVAQCGGREVVLHFPWRKRIAMDELRQDAPQLARLSDLWDEVKTLGFGGAWQFATETTEEMKQQQAGAEIAPEIVAGRFDSGFVASVAQLLENYHGPVKDGDFTAALMNPDAYKFASYVAPEYTPLARALEARGRVLLQLRVDPGTGNVRDATALSGDPTLAAIATTAAQKWRFVPGTTSAQPIHAMLDFAWRCP